MKNEKNDLIITSEYDRARRGNTPLSFLVYKTTPDLFGKSQAVLTKNLRRTDTTLQLEDSILVILPLTSKEYLPIVIEKIKAISESQSLDLELAKSFSYDSSSELGLEDVTKEIYR